MINLYLNMKLSIILCFSIFLALTQLKPVQNWYETFSSKKDWKCSLTVSFLVLLSILTTLYEFTLWKHNFTSIMTRVGERGRRPRSRNTKLKHGENSLIYILFYVFYFYIINLTIPMLQIHTANTLTHSLASSSIC